MAKKKEEVNLSEIDASFVISSFKNKERRNNPSSIPRALIPEHEKKQNTKKRYNLLQLFRKSRSASEASQLITKLCS